MSTREERIMCALLNFQAKMREEDVEIDTLLVRDDALMEHIADKTTYRINTGTWLGPSPFAYIADNIKVGFRR